MGAVHGPHSVGACLVLGTADLDESLPLMAREAATHVLLGHAHYRAVEHADFDAATKAIARVVLSGAKVPPALFEALEVRGLWTGQQFGMGEGLFLTTRPGGAPGRTAEDGGDPAVSARRGPDPGTGLRDRRGRR